MFKKFFDKISYKYNLKKKYSKQTRNKVASLIIISGVSGSGKSTAMKQLKNPLCATVELDLILQQLYTKLKVGDPKEKWYSFSPWEAFLKKHKNNSYVITSFRQEILKNISKHNKLLIIAGTHFLVSEIENMVIKALIANQRFMLHKKLFLDIEPEIVFAQRKKRNYKLDRDDSITLDRTINSVALRRKKLPKRGYEPVSYRELIKIIEKEFNFL